MNYFRLEQRIEEHMHQAHVPALALAVVNEREILSWIDATNDAQHMLFILQRIEAPGQSSVQAKRWGAFISSSESVCVSRLTWCKNC